MRSHAGPSLLLSFLIVAVVAVALYRPDPPSSAANAIPPADQGRRRAHDRSHPS